MNVSLLQPYLGEIEAATAPCFILEAAPASPEGTRLGGLPWLPAEVEWPIGGQRPLDFVGQLNFAEFSPELRADLGLPARGTLALFYDYQDQPWGFEVDDRMGWQVVFAPDPARGEIRSAVRGAVTFAERGLRPIAGESLPGFGDDSTPAFITDASDELADAFYDHAADLGGAGHQVRGHSNWVQNDARLECAMLAVGMYAGDPEAFDNVTPEIRADARNWNLLWQIASDEEDMMFGDLGNLYLMIRDADLAAGEFEKAWLVLQCG